MRSHRGTVRVTAAVAIALAAAATAVVTASAAPPATAPASTARDQQTLQRDVNAVVANGPTGALVEVANGKRVSRATSGTAVAGSTQPIDPSGHFRAGSVTKMFVATVVLQLVAEHRVGLDDPIDRWLPGLLPDQGTITVRELLNHTSGLYDETDTLPLNPPSAYLPLRWKTWTATELIARATAEPPLFPAGTAYHYSDTDYTVLGQLIERVTGNSYAREISDRILRPLGMSGTSLPGTRTTIPSPHAENYVPDGDGGVVDTTDMNPSVMGSAGELISTDHDLDTFTSALLGGRLLPPAELREMLAVSAPSQTGLGVEVMSLPCGRTAYGHDGDVLGSSTWAFATANGRRVSLSVTWGTNRPAQAAVTTLLDDALCGS